MHNAHVKPAHGHRLQLYNTMPVEILVSVAIIGICVGLVTTQAQRLLTKARMSEIMVIFTGKRIELMVHFALTGRTTASEAPMQPVAAPLPIQAQSVEDAISHPEYVQASPKQAQKVRKQSPEPAASFLDGLASKFSFTAKPGNPDSHFTAHLVDGVFVGTGKLQQGHNALGREFVLGITPLVAEHNVPWNILWSCGLRQPPYGWVPIGEQVGTNVPTHYLLSMCREKTDTDL